MTKSLLIMENCAQSLREYEELLVEINYRYLSGSLDFRAKNAIIKRVNKKIEELKKYGKDN